MSLVEKEEFFNGIAGIVEATNCEYHFIWERWHDSKEGYQISWKENLVGRFVTVGYLADKPVCVSFRNAMIKDKKVLFWHATSSVVDYDMINSWLEENVIKINDGITTTDANNFHIVAHSL